MTTTAQILRFVDNGELDVDHDALITWPDDNPDFASWLLSDISKGRDAVTQWCDTEELTQLERG